ncbi:hypothetical protein [Haloparvum sp. AD34]
MLNTVVADRDPARDDAGNVVKQASYLGEQNRQVLSGLSLDLEFQDVEYG